MVSSFAEDTGWFTGQCVVAVELTEGVFHQYLLLDDLSLDEGMFEFLEKVFHFILFINDFEWSNFHLKC